MPLLLKRWALTTLLLGAGCAAELDEAANQTASKEAYHAEQSDELGETSAPLYQAANKTLMIVAHQDDDVVMASPDIWDTFKDPNKHWTTIYLTSGDAGFPQCYWVERQAGVEEVYSQAAGANNAWDSSSLILPSGQAVLVRTLHDRPKIRLMFFGLQNRHKDDPSGPDPMGLWNGTKGSITTLNDFRAAVHRPSKALPYNREQLIEGLKFIMTVFAPTQIGMLDPSQLVPSYNFPDDHSDHVASALFSLAAAQRYQANPQPVVRMFHTYNTIGQPKNVDPDSAEYRWYLMTQVYQPHDKKICNNPFGFTVCGDLLGEDPTGTNIYAGENQACDSEILYTFLTEFEDRTYSYGFVDNVKGLIKTPGGCMSAPATVGAVVSVAGVCSPGAAAQTWTMQPNGTVKHSSGLCLNGTAAPASLTVTNCTSPVTKNQRFGITTGTKYTSSGSPAVTYPIVSQMRGADATCVERVGANYQLKQCAPVGTIVASQLGYYVQHATAPVTAGSAAKFSTADINTPKNYRTLVFGDIDGDGKDDVCIRRNPGGVPASGVACALGDGTGSFPDAKFKQTAVFGTGYDAPDTGGTLMMGRLNADNRLDLCARKSDGIHCAMSNTTLGGLPSFTTPARWSDNFANSIPFLYSGYETSESRYGSLRLVDLNKDGFSDICGRENGIECAYNLGGATFGDVFQATSTEYLDALIGWQLNGYGSTLQYADIDGDSYTDVCGRGAEGIICMVQWRHPNGTANNPLLPITFERAHLWTSDFSDYESWDDNEYRYNSIRLVDINGDGRADICGRSANGIICGYSQGTHFTTATEIMVSSRFDAAAGYDVNQYGSELGLARVNADARQDFCVRGPGGIKCSYGFAAP